MLLPLLLAATALAQDPPAAPATPDPSEAASADAASTPSGSPADDFGFVAWCRGALSGHMELYAAVKPEIARVRADKAQKLLADKSDAEAARLKVQLAKDDAREDELDGEQLKAGQDYLALYGRALATAEEAGQPHARGVEMTAQGYRIWSAARAADGKTRMYSYLMWDLPGRCETAAKSLQAKSSLFGAAFKRAEAPPAPETAPVSEAPAPAAAAEPAPAPVASSAETSPIQAPATDALATTASPTADAPPTTADDSPAPPQGPTVSGPAPKPAAKPKLRRPKPVAPSGA